MKKKGCYGEDRTEVIAIRFTKAEYTSIFKASRLNRSSMSATIRDYLASYWDKEEEKTLPPLDFMR